MKLQATIKAKSGAEILDKWMKDFQRYIELEERARTWGLLPNERKEWIKLRRLRRGVR